MSKRTQSSRTTLRLCRRLATASLLLLMMMPLRACLPETGESNNLEQTGRQDRGRDPGSYTVKSSEPNDAGSVVEDGDIGLGPDWAYTLLYSDVILSPDGKHLLGMAPLPGPGQGYNVPGLPLVAHNLETGAQKSFIDFVDLRRVNFSPDGKTAWLLLHDGRAVMALDLQTYKPGKTYYVGSEFTVLDVGPKGRFLVLDNLPRNDIEEFVVTDQCDFQMKVANGYRLINRCHVAIIDLKTGTSQTFTTPHPVRDLDFSPVHDELVMTWSTWKGVTPQATVAFYDPVKGSTTELVEFTNCADELKIVPGKPLALLSPRSCAKDPISFIDLEKRTFLGNLPGFGPVAITPDGKTAVGFTHKQVMIDEWDHLGQKQEVGLIFVDIATRKWQIVDYGDKVPTYTLSPDGAYLYSYEDHWKWVEGRDGVVRAKALPSMLSQWHVASHKRSVVSSHLKLRRFVWSNDGQSLYFLSSKKNGQLHRIEVGTPKAEHVLLDTTAELLNIRPQGDYLVLGKSDTPTFYKVPTDNLAPKYNVIQLGVGSK